MGWCLYTVALFVDAIQAILTFFAIGVVVSPIISIGASFLFWLWFQFLSVSFIANPRRLTTFFSEFIGEVIPGLGALPLWTIGTVMIVKITRAEDEGNLLGSLVNITEKVIKKPKSLPVNR